MTNDIREDLRKFQGHLSVYEYTMFAFSPNLNGVRNAVLSAGSFNKFSNSQQLLINYSFRARMQSWPTT